MNAKIGINSGKQISFYTEKLPSVIERLRQHIPHQHEEVAEMNAEGKQFIKQLDALLGQLLWTQLISMGMVVRNNFIFNDLKSQISSIDFYDSWLQETLAVFVRQGYLNQVENAYTPTNKELPDKDQAWNEWKTNKLLGEPHMKSQVTLVEITLRALPDILTGKRNATEVLFPNSSMSLVEGIYKENKVADYFNEVLVDTVVAYLKERIKQDPEAKINILEIGAGTGGTSNMVFQKLKPYQKYIHNYCYTDLSKAFLLHAKKAYGAENPYLTYQIFDVEKPVAAQGIETDKYDMVIAANVLHATKEINRTLQNAKAVLRNSGLILLNEMSHNTLFTHLTFGLLEGWWLSEDAAIRIPGCPGLFPDAWEKVLETEGFTNVLFPAFSAHELGQQIVVAQSDGIVKQQRQTTESNVKIKTESSASKIQHNKDTLSPAAIAKKTNDPISADHPTLYIKTVAFLKKLISDTLKIPVNSIDAAEPLETYGIDSILVVQLNNALNEIFEEISSTLFFEYQTIEALTDYFIKTQKEILVKLVGLEPEPTQNNEKLVPDNLNKEKQTTTAVFKRSKRNLKNEPVTTSPPTNTDRSREPIAIIGLTGRYPQAANLQEYWENLKNGKNCIEEIPQERWKLDDFYIDNKQEALEKGKSYGKWGAFLDGFADFDPLFFNISPREAINIDPQERLFIQACWEVVEDAGYTRSQLATEFKSRIGVFAGITRTGFELYGPDLWKQGEQLFPHTSFSSVANRVSYLLNLKGPSLPIDTMCSSSLTAIHEACEHLYRGECEMAIAGGVNLYLHPSSYILFSAQQMLSADGKCKSFGKDGNGFVPGEGVGVVLLKQLSKAIRDNDNIHAIIRSTGINHGGKTNGYTVPNPVAQAELIRETLDKSATDARSISYIEAHGTGTELGDPIEITGLTQAFQKETTDNQFCAIGSVKSNIGHCEAAAGMAGLTKIILQMKHKQLVPSLHTSELNPNINFSKTPFVVQKQLSEWRRPILNSNSGNKEFPRIAGVSSFGAGGANAHLLIEEYIDQEIGQHTRATDVQTPFVILLSARNEKSLHKQAERLLTSLDTKQLKEIDLPRMMYTLQMGREAMEERLAVVINTIDELKEKLSCFLKGNTMPETIYVGKGKRSKAVAADVDLQKTIDNCLNNGKLDKLAALWCEGYHIEWKKIYPDTKPKKISLPTYPFAKERYWLPEIKAQQASVNLAVKPIGTDKNENTSVSAPLKDEPLSILTFNEVWKEQELHSVSSLRMKTIVCFLNDKKKQQCVLDELQERFSDHVPEVIFVSHEDSFGTMDATHYTINGRSREDVVQLFLDLEKHRTIDAIWYMWPISNSMDHEDYTSIVFLIQALSTSKLKVSQLTLAGSYQTRLEHCYVSSWMGFERSLGLILMHTQVNVILYKSNNVSEWIEKLCKEYEVKGNHSAWYKENKRFIPVMEQDKFSDQKTILKNKGTYLITGGMGGLGYMFADYLAETYQANLILIGRSVLSAKQDSQLKKLKAHGTNVIYYQADISDHAVMQELLKNIKEEAGIINGILHTAGIQSHENLLEKNIADFNNIMLPKIKGTEVLSNLFDSKELDFCCYFSSSSAILGDFGSCDYAIANRFQMAYGQYLNEQQNSEKIKVINWPLWRAGGMRMDEERTEAYLKSSGQDYLETKDGLKLFEQVLASNATQQLIIVGQLSRVNRFLNIDKSADLKMKSQGITLNPGKGRIKIMKGWSTKACLDWDLKEQVSQLMKIDRDKLDGDTNLVDFGFDSITLAQLAKIVSSHYDIQISPSVFFEYSTLEKLSTYYLQEYPNELSAFYSTDNSAASSALFIHENNEKIKNPSASLLNDKSELVTEKMFSSVDEPIAIIGMSGRFPQARTIQEMWDMLAGEKSAVTEIPAERWDWRKYYSHSKEEGKTNSKWIGSIPGVSEFDPLFFEISPLEATYMDPRQRLLLQESWKALEDAGYGARQLKENKIGMFVGAEEGEYQLITQGKGSITSNHSAILAARLSYFLNLNGPNISINTACSSGLVATHQACQSLRSNECDTAIAAGLNLILTPMAYLQMSQAGMLSDDGTCFTFDTRANGIVPGEAVAVVVLKRLSKAQADGDPIHAVIQGSGINYDGKTNGITAPSGSSQASLMKEIYDRYKINPEDIEHIVTHGTGTRLGDPIEINALYNTFKKYTKKQAYCAITSSKTNFGHTFAASGLVSLIGLVQALKHETIPASLNCQNESDYINWKESHFYVNKKSKPWRMTSGGKNKGAVSAFSMSGTNAHMVVENYSADLSAGSINTPPYYLLLLSAKTQDALLEKVEDMSNFIRSDVGKNSNLSKISYTLQDGRQHFSHRCAIVIQDAEDALFAWKHIGGKEKLPNIFQNISTRDFTAQNAIKEYAVNLLKQAPGLYNDAIKYKETLFALAELYCQGYELPWNELYGPQPPQRIHLPTYPFAREHYWISDAEIRSANTATHTNLKFIHPLVHQNTSNLEAVKFTSTFTGQEFFTADHIVKGQSILPGVAYLEMARAAVNEVILPKETQAVNLILKNVMWVRPFIIGNIPQKINTSLFLNDTGCIDYEITSITDEANGVSVLHSQGTVVITANSEAQQLLIQSLLKECNDVILSADQCYDAFRLMNVDYGPGHRLINEVHVGKNQVLTRLLLPASLSDTIHQFTLHPGLLDAALQGAIGLLLAVTDLSLPENRALLKPALPFALQELEILNACTTDMWAYIRYSEGSKPEDTIQKLDVDLCNAEGVICVKFRGFATRPLESEIKNVEAASAVDPMDPVTSLIGNVILKPVWDPVPLETQEVLLNASEQVVVIGATSNNREEILSIYPNAHFIEILMSDTLPVIVQKLKFFTIETIIWLAPYQQWKSLGDHAIIEAQDKGVVSCFRFIKALLQLGYGSANLTWNLITVKAQPTYDNEQVDPAQSSLHGLMGAMAKEYAHWKVKLVDVESEDDLLLNQVFTLPPDAQGNAWVYRNKQWLKQQLLPCQRLVSKQNLFKIKGVYVIIGGAGGIGEIWSKFLIETYQAHVIWIGRRKKDTAIQEKINGLGKLGPAPVYIAADATNETSLQNAYTEIKQLHPDINGIVHSAIVLLDQSLAAMDEDRFKAGLIAKVNTSVNMANVFKNELLDFVLFFSSMTSFTKAPGQSNYAAGCTFKDSFAHQLGQQWQCPVKIINWGYWGSVGIVASKNYQDRMALAGLGSIEPSEGIEALGILLGGTINQLAYMKTTKPLSMAGISTNEFIATYPLRFSNSKKLIPGDELLNELLAQVKKSSSDFLKVDVKDIDGATAWEEYGLDHIVLTEFANYLSKIFHVELHYATLVEYTNPQQLSEYLLQGNNSVATVVKPITADASCIEKIKSKLVVQALEMDELLGRLLWAQLQKAGLFTQKEMKQELVEAAAVRNGYQRWLEESIHIFIQRNFLTIHKNTYSIANTASFQADELWNEWEMKKSDWLKNPNLQAQVILVETTLKALPDIITGKRAATDVLFPNSSMQMVEGVYKNNLVADYFNEALADQIVAFVKESIKKDPAARINIMEIGAGTGGTSAMVFQKLKKYQEHVQEYCYTDISKAFLMYAENLYGPENPYLTYQLFDVEKPIAAQGVAACKYDLVIATNVLHATKNIRQTLRNAKAVLKQNGMLLLNELLGNSLFAHLTFGLLDGWWLYEDAELRIPGCPMLTPPTWKAILEQEGFQSILFPVQEAQELGQQIVMAASDGIVRQKYDRFPAKSRIPEAVQEKKAPKVIPVQKSSNVHDHTIQKEIPEGSLKDKSTAYFKKLIGDVLKMPIHKIDASAPFDSYGIDSILVVQLNNALQEVFANVSSTLFFEYQTIDALTDHFIKTQKDRLVEILGVTASPLSEKFSKEVTASVKERQLLSHTDFGKPRRFKQLRESQTNFIASQQLQEPIAIIGLSGKYAQADTLTEFWNNLKTGKNCISEIPKERWNWEKYFSKEKGKWGFHYTKWGGFIKDVDKFDPLFFHISPAEAERIDPQERLYVETVHASIEDAGYTPSNLLSDRKIGVFVGVMNGNYPSGPSYHSIANRVSYLFNFQGPSLAVDTACSSSLTAIHLAIESIRSGSCEVAIAGGVNLIVDPVHYMRLSAVGMLSEGSQCKAFGSDADGFVDGEGVGAVVLKPLSKAILDNDHIYGVIKGSTINAGGKTNGYTVPNPNAQAQLIVEAFQKAQVTADRVSYIEAHGTGTSLGDPIEIAGLTKAFEMSTSTKQFCSIGSVKSNIGHCESAAGIASLTKVLLQMKHKKLVPSLNSAVLNPNIDFTQTPFIVQQELVEWKSTILDESGKLTEYPRIAGISSFGAGGANAHLVVEEYLVPVTETIAGDPAMIVLSAKNKERLLLQAKQLLTQLEEQQISDQQLTSVAFTLQLGREAMEERIAMLVYSIDELKNKLNAYLKGKHEDIYQGQVKNNKEALEVFTADEELQEALEKWIQRRKYDKLLNLWVKGLLFDWKKLYPDFQPMRISLPTYPFAKERYWLENKEDINTSQKTLVKKITPFNEMAYNEIIDKLLEDSLTVEGAVNKIECLNNN
jgi:polyketide synthase PksM